MKGQKDYDTCDIFSPTQNISLLKERLPDVTGLSEIFKILGDETRTKIIYLLSFRELCVCDLAAVLDMSLPAVSHHLRLLKVMRLVKYRREGKMVYYTLDDAHILHIIQEALDHYTERR